MSAEPLTNTVNLIAEILQICHTHPDLSDVVKSRLDEIVQHFDPDSSFSQPGKTRVQQAIYDLTQSMKEQNTKVNRPTSVMYREIAQVLAKKHNLPYDTKLKRSAHLMDWFEEHWEVIARSFLVLLKDQLQNKEEDVL
jgi:hypothetical protein